MNSERLPLKLLMHTTQSEIIVRLKDNREFRGRLTSCDSYMNMILSDAIEIKDGNKLAKYGEVFIRGNNILWIQTEWDETEEE
ncbi:MAG: LSM domain-containing protein [Promethearchaeota archaeon]